MKLAFLMVFAAFAAQCSEVRIVADFRGDVPPRRAMKDIKFPCDLSNAAGLSFDFRIDSLSEFSMFTFHFNCDGKWVGAKFPALEEGKWHRVVVKRPRSKDDKKDWSKVKAFRVSGWRGGTNRTYLAVRNIAVEPLVPEKKPTKAELELSRAAIAETNRMALAQLAATPPPKGERRLIWAHYPTGIRGKGWEYSVKTLKKGGFTDLIANLARGSRAAYKSEVLGMATTAEGRDRLEECLAACRRHGVKLHVWNCCWRTGWGTTKEELERFAAEGRLIKSESEGGWEWLCPSHPANRRMLVDSMVELAKKGVDGVHFDYIRYPDGAYCVCDGCRKRFEAKIGRKLSDWPKGLNSDRTVQRQWREFRRDAITAPVKEVAELVHRKYPDVEISAAVFTDPLADWDWMGQDWPSWCEKGYLDFVCPMTYENDLESFARKQRKHMVQVTPKVPRYPGIGLGVWPKDGLDVARFAEQVVFLRKSGIKGYSIFELATRFERFIDTVAPALIGGGR